MVFLSGQMAGCGSRIKRKCAGVVIVWATTNATAFKVPAAPISGRKYFYPESVSLERKGIVFHAVGAFRLAFRAPRKEGAAVRSYTLKAFGAGAVIFRASGIADARQVRGSLAANARPGRGIVFEVVYLKKAMRIHDATCLIVSLNTR